MNEQMKAWAEKINQLSLRERALLIVTAIVLLVFLWWSLYAAPLRQQRIELNQLNQNLQTEISTLESTSSALQQRIAQGVPQKQQRKLEQLKRELLSVNQLLKQKTRALIAPDEMFELMQSMIFSESRLKLTSIKRKEVLPLFVADKEDSAQQPEIFRHVMQIGFDGRYKDVVSYIEKLEGLSWKLIWDRIELKSERYPVVHVDIEISTLSDNQSWVGL